MPTVPPVILNNTPLVALWMLQKWDLLRDLFGDVLIPVAVEAEFLATHSTPRRQDLANTPWIQTTSLVNPRHARSYTGLDKGEAEVLALATERAARLVVIDERKGRQYARHLGLPVTGTLGILLLAKQQQMIPSVALLIQQLEKAGLYLAPKLVDQVLEMAQENR
ncbi:MAG: DUF3368 domain-containing protein [Chloroflexi bacterium]|nr:DUF3368 domain-containing protein [Chloroflexota bacterium]